LGGGVTWAAAGLPARAPARGPASSTT